MTVKYALCELRPSAITSAPRPPLLFICFPYFSTSMRLLLAVLLLAEAQLWASNPGTTNHSAHLTQKDVLSIKDGRFFLEGEPFAGISFNKFDLFWQLYDQLTEGKQLNAVNPLVQAQDKALRNLHELGFKTIRIFALPWGPAGPESYANPQKRENLYAASDKTLAPCDAHDIRVVWSVSPGSLTDTKWANAQVWVFVEQHARALAS